MRPHRIALFIAWQAVAMGSIFIFAGLVSHEPPAWVRTGAGLIVLADFTAVALLWGRIRNWVFDDSPRPSSGVG